jgi:hypothetical protein
MFEKSLKLGDITSTIHKRKSFYKDILVQLIFFRLNNEWKISFGRFLPLLEKEKKPEKIQWNYGNFLIFQSLIDFSVFCEIVKDIVEQKKFKIPLSSENLDWVEGTVEYEFRSTNSNFIPSKHWPTHFDWPLDFYLFQLRWPGDATPITWKPFFAKDLPFFPNMKELKRVVFNLPPDAFYYDWSADMMLSFWLPNYKARILPLSVKGNEVTIELEYGEKKIKNLRGKMYILTSEEKGLSYDLEFTNSKYKISLPTIPSSIYLLIYDEEEIIDTREIHLGTWPEKELKEIVKYESPPEELKAVILGGEKETVEFKEELTDRVLKTICSFANTKGGRIFLGVDDEGKIKGIKEGLQKTKIEEQLQNMIRSHFDPPFPKALISEQEIDGKKVFIIYVEEGKEKPYYLRERGIYIRANGTDRIATRLEVEKLFKKIIL